MCACIFCQYLCLYHSCSVPTPICRHINPLDGSAYMPISLFVCLPDTDTVSLCQDSNILALSNSGIKSIRQYSGEDNCKYLSNVDTSTKIGTVVPLLPFILKMTLALEFSKCPPFF